MVEGHGRFKVTGGPHPLMGREKYANGAYAYKISGKRGHTIVYAHSPTLEKRKAELPCTVLQLYAWINGQVIQEAMANLSASQREFLMTGMTDDEFPSEPLDHLLCGMMEFENHMGDRSPEEQTCAGCGEKRECVLVNDEWNCEECFHEYTDSLQ